MTDCWQGSVERIQPNTQKDSGYMIKMTDECQKVLIDAQKQKWPIKINVSCEKIQFEVHSPGSTHCFDVSTSMMNQNEIIDGLQISKGAETQQICQVKGRLQVKATEGGLVQAKAKFQKAKEQDVPKVTLPFTDPKDKKRVFPTKASLLDTRQKAKEETVIPPKKTSPPLTSRYSTPMLTELNNKSIRERVLHIVATNKYKNCDEIIKRLKTDSYGRDGNVSDEFAKKLKQVGEILDEITEKSKENNNLTLKKEFHSMVDKRWKWFSSEEKANVVGLLSKKQNSDSIAPTRRSGNFTMHAPSSHPKTVENSVDSPVLKTELSTLKNDAPNQKGDSANQKSDLKYEMISRSGSEESMKEEGEIRTPPEQSGIDLKKEMLFTPPCTSEDFTVSLTDIKTSQQFNLYKTTYQAEYGEYISLHNEMQKKIDIIEKYKHSFQQATPGTKEHKKIMISAQNYFDHVSGDCDFIRGRQRLSDLHSRLQIFGDRFEAWKKLPSSKRK